MDSMASMSLRAFHSSHVTNIPPTFITDSMRRGYAITKPSRDWLSTHPIQYGKAQPSTFEAQLLLWSRTTFSCIALYGCGKLQVAQKETCNGLGDGSISTYVIGYNTYKEASSMLNPNSSTAAPSSREFGSTTAKLAYRCYESLQLWHGFQLRS